MPRLVDTTIRVLSQEPLAGLMPTADLLRLAELLDGAGFAYLEVSGGGVFDSAVRRGVESPWERIRALKARTSTPLALALRGRFLVGSRPVGGDFARRFVASAAQSGIEVFRLHDPLNDVDNLREAAEAIVDCGRRVRGRPALRQRPARGARRRGEAAAGARRGAHPPERSRPPCCSRTARASSCTSCATSRASPVGLYAQGAGGNALAAAIEAARAGADVIATAVYPIALTHAPRLRGGRRAGARGARPRHRDRPGPAVGRRRPRRRAHRRRAGLAGRAAHRRARGPAQAPGRARRRARRAAAQPGRRRPARRGARRGRQGAHRGRLAAARGADREHRRVAGAPERARRRTATRRWSTSCATSSRDASAARRHRSTRRSRAPSSSSATAREDEPPVDLDDAARSRPKGSRRARRSCCCSRCSARRPSRSCARSASARAATSRSVRAASTRHAPRGSARSSASCRRPGVGEITIEEDGMRVSVRRTAEPTHVAAPAAPAAPGGEPDRRRSHPVDDSLVRVESPMVGTFYRSPAPGVAAVRRGGRRRSRRARRCASSRR